MVTSLRQTPYGASARGRSAFCRVELPLLGQPGLRRGKMRVENEWVWWGQLPASCWAGSLPWAGARALTPGTGVAEQGELHGRPGFHGRRPSDAGGAADAASTGTGGITGGPGDAGNVRTDGAVATDGGSITDCGICTQAKQCCEAVTAGGPVCAFNAETCSSMVGDARAAYVRGCGNFVWTTRAAWSGNPPAACR